MTRATSTVVRVAVQHVFNTLSEAGVACGARARHVRGPRGRGQASATSTRQNARLDASQWPTLAALVAANGVMQVGGALRGAVAVGGRQ